MAKEPRTKGYPKLKNYKPSQFMLPTSHYDKKKADRNREYHKDRIQQCCWFYQKPGIFSFSLGCGYY